MSKVERHREIVENLTKLYECKNADYGDSYADTRKIYPHTIVIKLMEKTKRLETLIGGHEDSVGESIEDTLKDIANYCIMELLEREVEEDGIE